MFVDLTSNNLLYSWIAFVYVPEFIVFEFDVKQMLYRWIMLSGIRIQNNMSLHSANWPKHGQATPRSTQNNSGLGLVESCRRRACEHACPLPREISG